MVLLKSKLLNFKIKDFVIKNNLEVLDIKDFNSEKGDITFFTQKIQDIAKKQKLLLYNH